MDADNYYIPKLVEYFSEPGITKGLDPDQNKRTRALHDGDISSETYHSTILDRHNRTIAQILTRFRNVIMAATAPLPQTGNAIEHAALNRLTMETECAALISEVEGLLAINREIKALWIRGALRKPGEEDGREADLDKKAEGVARLYDQILDDAAADDEVEGEIEFDFEYDAVAEGLELVEEAADAEEFEYDAVEAGLESVEEATGVDVETTFEYDAMKEGLEFVEGSGDAQ
ncbi:hypothetical protein F4804DRAFT_332925 [Jackrogersella minutella]|nr:hypothetical protein F4804DRAFT_332925 [Jackrogersella minutella]